MKTKPSASRAGALLVVTVIVLLAIGAVGVGLLSMATSARYQRVVVGYADRAYYLAESGASYVKAVRLLDAAALPVGTFTMANGDQFHVITASNNNHIVVVSTGIVNPGTRMEMRRRIVVDILEKITGDLVPVGFDLNNDGKFDDEVWDTMGVDPSIKKTGPSGGQPALDLKGEEGQIYLAWQDNPELDLVSVWALNGGLLGYDVQMKIKAFDTGSQAAYSKHYMLGFSFRLHPTTQHCYGLSFFRSLTGKDGGKPPDWVTALPKPFQDLRGTNVYLVLWYRNGAQFELLNQRKLTLADGVIEMRDGRPELRDYNTLLLELKEVFTLDGARENHISAYLQNTDVYPLWTSNTNVVWQSNTNVFPQAVVWENGVVTNVDARLTTSNFLQDKPAEVGIHVFYDLIGADKKFFDDFALRMEGYSQSRQGVEIQY